MATNQFKHPLQRAGTSQAQRRLAPLSPSYAPLDEQSELDLLAYIWEMAKVVVHHSVAGDKLRKSDWLDFFRTSLPIQLALIGNAEPRLLRAEFEQSLDQFDSGLGNQQLEPLFMRTGDLALLLNRWHTMLSDQTALKTDLGALIKNDLRFVLLQLIQLSNNAASQFDLPKPGWLTMLSELTENSVWGVSKADVFVVGLAPLVPQIKGTFSVKLRIYRDRIEELFDVFLDGVARISALASSENYREQSLNAIRNHPAHIGLLVAFIRMLKDVQGELNRITNRQLEFYLKDVLGLSEQDAIPDQLHLIVELEKSVQQHKIKADTKFIAAEKDKNNQTISFAPAEEAILNQAQVVSLRTLFRSSDPKVFGYRIAAGANFYDGLEEPFPDPNETRWKTLGAARLPNDLPADPARMGLYVASSALLLNEGNATVCIRFYVEKPIAPDAIGTELLNIWYSSDEGWELANDFERTVGSDTHRFAINTGIESGTQAHYLDVRFVVLGGIPLLFADDKVLGANYGTTHPIVKLELIPPDDIHDEAVRNRLLVAYDTLSQVVVTDMYIYLEDVELSNLLLSNDDGPQDPAKPFLPFGARPKINASLTVGSDEAFRKKLTALSVKIHWDQLPVESFTMHYADYDNPPDSGGTPPRTFKYSLHGLKHGTWTELDSEPQDLFGGVGSKPQSLDSISVSADDLGKIGVIEGPLMPYSPVSADGFLRIELEGMDFLHEEYPSVLARKLLEIANLGLGGATITAIQGHLANNEIADAQSILSSLASEKLPNLPYTPKIRALSLVYTSKTKLSQDDSQIVFGHLYPFEEGNYARKKVDAESATPLFPQIGLDTESEATSLAPLEGALFVGLQNLVPGSSLQLLFQVAEATADPMFAIKEMKWWFLADNEWHILQPDIHILEDASQNLTTSGLVRIALPFEISNAKSTILPSSYHWLRVTIQDGVSGLADTVDVHAQVLRGSAVLTSAHETDRLSDSLPAESITKPLVNDAAIKKVTQKYASFGGKPAEREDSFYQRVSERLRHKGRAVTLFDYERIVLQAFPEIYKVKCLPHTRREGNKLITNVSGFITIVVIPNISKLTFAERIEPRASRALLERIERYLNIHSPPFIRIEVVNPEYQKILICSQVAFNQGKDKNFYRKTLTDDVTRFMTPWAFGEQDKLSFGGKVFRSSILHYVESREYVNFLVDFSIRNLNSEPQTVIEAETEHSILVYQPGENDWTSVDEKPSLEKIGEGWGYDSIPLRSSVDSQISGKS